MNFSPTSTDLDAINYQRHFIENAINYYNRQIEYQQRLLNELRTNSIWYSTSSSNLQEQIVMYEKNIYFQRFIISQYRQLLFSLKQMWDTYVFDNRPIPMDLTN